MSKSKGRKGWGRKKWIIAYWLEKMKNPFLESYSIRQAFYEEIPKINRLVPDKVKENTKDWQLNFYIGMCKILSDLVLSGRVSYERINVYDDSGASKILNSQSTLFKKIPIGKVQIEYPIEIWVENNATFNSIAPLVDYEKGEYCLNLVSQKGVAKTQEIEKLKLYRSNEVKLILNLTDFDPSGVNMPKDLQRRINRIGLNIEVKHIGIFPDQIPEERKITSLHKYKKRDKNLAKFLEDWGYIELVRKGYGFEIQTLNPSEIRQLISKYIIKTVNEHGLEKRDRNV